MAIKLEQNAREAIARRRKRGRSAEVDVHVAIIPARGVVRQLVADWADPGDDREDRACQDVGDVKVHLGRRIARYSYWHDVTIAAWHLGPLERLMVVDEPLVMLALEEWERTHPDPHRHHAA